MDGDEDDWIMEQPEGEEEGAIEAVDKWNYSKKGFGYVAANGSRIKNYGEMRIAG